MKLRVHQNSIIYHDVCKLDSARLRITQWHVIAVGINAVSERVLSRSDWPWTDRSQDKYAGWKYLSDASPSCICILRAVTWIVHHLWGSTVQQYYQSSGAGADLSSRNSNLPHEVPIVWKVDLWSDDTRVRLTKYVVVFTHWTEDVLFDMDSFGCLFSLSIMAS